MIFKKHKKMAENSPLQHNISVRESIILPTMALSTSGQRVEGDPSSQPVKTGSPVNYINKKIAKHKNQTNWLVF